jgi:formamidopyrimidine-DNA glycosylase
LPELPDIALYVDALERRILGERLERVRLTSPFLLRTVDPPLSSADGQTVTAIRRVGKRIAIGLDNGIWLVIHLMVAGRFRWDPPGAPVPRRLGLAAFDFETGALVLTEAGTKKRASLRVVSGESGLAAEDPGGLEPLEIDLAAFGHRLTLRNHTLKRALTDPGLFSGIGNAYSDEILHAAGLSPIKWTGRLEDHEVERLFDAVRNTLTEWSERLCAEAGDDFPRKVTAFRDDMSVHGKYGQACPVCGSPVQRIRYAENETNYCPTCQTEGKVLADRAMSRLLGKDWPRTLEELEKLRTTPEAAARGDSGA